MSHETYFLVCGTIFFMVAAAHLTRLIMGWKITIAGWRRSPLGLGSRSHHPGIAVGLGFRTGVTNRGEVHLTAQDKTDDLPPGSLQLRGDLRFLLPDHSPLPNVRSISLRKTTAGSAASYTTSSQCSCPCAATSRLSLMPWARPSGSPPVRIDSSAGSSLP